MKRQLLSLLPLAAVFVSVVALAERQNPPQPTPAQNPESPSRNAVGTQLLSGSVWDYTPGQSITIKASDGKEYRMPLTSGVRVDGAIVVGRLAAVMWTTDSGGNTRVMSLTGPPGGPSDLVGSAPSRATPPATAGPPVTPTPRPRPTPKSS